LKRLVLKPPLHELATDAGKYVALSNDKGCVDIRWGTNGDTLTMNWTERWGATGDHTEATRGTIVMEVMTARSVDSDVRLDYAASGLIWRLTCPAARA
jgi:two-component sensor histidine kinase